jgi:hypothetical protein
MSVISSVSNYGGRVVDNQQGVKQFYISPSQSSIATWIYKRISGGSIVQTPADSTKAVVINNDLVVAGSLFNTSDERLKENISLIEDADVENLFQINPIHFTYKNDLLKKKHIGVLAQDVEKLFPQLVSDNEIGVKTVNYQGIIPLVLAKLKCMQQEIDELKVTNSYINASK